VKGQPASPQTDRGLVDLLYQLADDELVIGHRASEWTGVAPHIEEDVAFSSIAQDEVSHAALFYRLLADLGEGGGDPDRIAFGRPPEAFRNAILLEQLNGDWADEIARHFLYSEYEAVLLPRLERSPHRPLAEAARLIAREESYHRAHFRRWLERLAQAGGEARGRIQRSLRRAYWLAAGLFEPGPAEEETVRWRGCSIDDLRKEWDQAVIRYCAALDLVLPTGSPGVPDEVPDPLGGRRGVHSPAMRALVDELTQVYRLDPSTTW